MSCQRHNVDSVLWKMNLYRAPLSLPAAKLWCEKKRTSRKNFVFQSRKKKIIQLQFFITERAIHFVPSPTGFWVFIWLTKKQPGLPASVLETTLTISICKLKYNKIHKFYPISCPGSSSVVLLGYSIGCAECFARLRRVVFVDNPCRPEDDFVFLWLCARKWCESLLLAWLLLSPLSGVRWWW